MNKDYTLFAYRLKAISEVLSYSQHIADATNDEEFINAINYLFSEELLRIDDILLQEN